MKNDDSLTRAKKIIIKVVGEKIPWGRAWRVSREFTAWIEGLSEQEFDDYLSRLKSLTRVLQTEVTPNEAGTFIIARSDPVDNEEGHSLLRRKGGEATAYYALAVWRTMQVEIIRADMDRAGRVNGSLQ